MPYTPERASVNQRIQIGAESTSSLGVAVAASKQLLNYDCTFTVTPDVTFHRPTGHKYDTVQELQSEWLDVAWTGTFDYNTCIYPLASSMGSITPVAHGASSTAKDWIFIPPVAGSIVPQTYTVMQGDTVTRAHSGSYGIFTQFGYKIDRKTSTSSGKMLAQQIADGITLTASPTAIPLAPVIGKQVNVFVDPTSTALGTTQMTRVLSIDFNFDGIYGPLWVLNRATAGFTSHVDMVPKATFKIKLAADAQGMTFLGYLRSGTTYYMRVDMQGAVIDTPNSINNGIKHDIAFKVGKPTAFSDDQGVFAEEWECTLVEDSAWGAGQSQIITVTNLITAL